MRPPMLMFVFDEHHFRWEAVSSLWLPDTRRSPTQGFTGATIGDMALRKIRDPVREVLS